MTRASIFGVASILCVSLAIATPPEEGQKASAATKVTIGSSTDTSNEQRPQWSSWGEVVRGLQCRISIPRAVEQGLPVEATVEFRCSPKDLAEGTDTLDTYLWQATFALELTRPGINEPFVVETDSPTRGMPGFRSDRHRPIPLDGTSIAPLNLTFRLARLFDDLVPGEYECRVRFSPPAEPWNWPKEKAASFWHGTARSGPSPLKILPPTPKTRTFLLPKRLRLVRRSYPPNIPPLANPPSMRYWLEVSYLEEDAEEVTFQVRNGHFVGTNWESNRGGGLSGGPPTPDGGFGQFHQYAGGDLNLSYKVELFETCELTGHFWAPGQCGYRVLWKRSFELHLTEDEINAVQEE